jgi:hypothetical protein
MPYFNRPGTGSQARLIRAGVEGLGERAVKRKADGEDRLATYAPAGKLPGIIEAFEKAKKASSKAEIVGLINDLDVPREAIPTQWPFLMQNAG